MKTVAIIGGGITGLSAAFHLKEQAKTRGLSLACRLIEREAKFGGKILTDRVNGFIIEGGPDSFISLKPWAIDLCQRAGARAYEWLREAMTWYERAEAVRPTGNDDALLRWNACARLIMGDRRLVPAPDERGEPLLLE